MLSLDEANPLPNLRECMRAWNSSLARAEYIEAGPFVIKRILPAAIAQACFDYKNLITIAWPNLPVNTARVLRKRT